MSIKLDKFEFYKPFDFILKLKENEAIPVPFNIPYHMISVLIVLRECYNDTFAMLKKKDPHFYSNFDSLVSVLLSENVGEFVDKVFKKEMYRRLKLYKKLKLFLKM